MTNQTPGIETDPVKIALSRFVAGLLVELFDRPDAADVIGQWERGEILFMISPRGLAAIANREPEPASEVEPDDMPGLYL